MNSEHQLKCYATLVSDDSPLLKKFMRLPTPAEWVRLFRWVGGLIAAFIIVASASIWNSAQYVGKIESTTLNAQYKNIEQDSLIMRTRRDFDSLRAVVNAVYTAKANTDTIKALLRARN